MFPKVWRSVQVLSSWREPIAFSTFKNGWWNECTNNEDINLISISLKLLACDIFHGLCDTRTRKIKRNKLDFVLARDVSTTSPTFDSI